MNDPVDRSTRPPSPATADGPAGDLGDVWGFLDALPAASASVDLAATTVDLVAAKVAGGARPKGREPAGLGTWAVRIGSVAAALVAGLALGRATAPDPDRRVLEQLPLIEHLDLLREAGSVQFLEALAERMTGRQGPARWMRFARDPEALRRESREFDAGLADLRRELEATRAEDDVLAERRRRVESLPADRRAELERAAEAFETLSSLDRRELTGVARVLTGTGNERLQDAARMWHLVVAAMNPVFRRTLVEMPSAERLEVMERSPGRFEPRPPGFRGTDEPPAPPRGGPNGFPRAGGFPSGGRPDGWGGPRGEGGPERGRPPVKPAGPPRGGDPQEAPGETPAPPR